MPEERDMSRRIMPGVRDMSRRIVPGERDIYRGICQLSAIFTGKYYYRTLEKYFLIRQ